MQYMCKTEQRLMSSKKITNVNKSLLHMLRRAEQYAADIYSEEVGNKGLTPRQFTVLLAIDKNEGVNQTELVANTGIDRSTLADLVARLIRKGLVQRRRTKEDARTNSIRLSAAGRRALDATQPAAANVNKRLLATLPTESRKDFIAGLEGMSKALDAGLSASNGKNGTKQKTKPQRTASSNM
jgi:DNA-binding MarR family transcriptional regulator